MADKSICTIQDCGKPAYGRGWCQVHYTRWRRHGDPLTRTKPANGDVQNFYHNVVLKFDGDDCLIWPFNKVGGGYGSIWLGHRYNVHKLVCEATHGPSPSSDYEAAHACGNSSCVNRKHLSWKTRRANYEDRILHDTHCRGERSVLSKITEDDVRMIRSLRGKEPQSKIAARFGIGQKHVSDIQTGKKWGWLKHQPNALS